MPRLIFARQISVGGTVHPWKVLNQLFRATCGMLAPLDTPECRTTKTSVQDEGKRDKETERRERGTTLFVFLHLFYWLNSAVHGSGSRVCDCCCACMCVFVRVCVREDIIKPQVQATQLKKGPNACDFPGIPKNLFMRLEEQPAGHRWNTEVCLLSQTEAETPQPKRHRKLTPTAWLKSGKSESGTATDASLLPVFPHLFLLQLELQMHLLLFSSCFPEEGLQREFHSDPPDTAPALCRVMHPCHETHPFLIFTRKVLGA